LTASSTSNFGGKKKKSTPWATVKCCIMHLTAFKMLAATAMEDARHPTCIIQQQILPEKTKKPEPCAIAAALSSFCTSKNWKTDVFFCSAGHTSSGWLTQAPASRSNFNTSVRPRFAA
jgi:hypothetical protein